MTDLEKFTAIGDYVISLMYAEILKLKDLVDIDKCSSDALKYRALSMGLIFPDFADIDVQREVVRNGASVLKKLYTVAGLEYYLNLVFSPGSVTVDVTSNTFGGVMVQLSVADSYLPNYDDIDTSGSSADSCAYLYNAAYLDVEFTVTVTGTLTSEQQDFLEEVCKWFLPFGDSENVTINYVYV